MGGGSGGGDKSEDAARVQAGQQKEALDYLKQTERLPQAYREGSLQRLGSDYGFSTDAYGNIVSDGSTISQRAKDSPFYTEAVRLGEEGVLRNASATGGLRSGSANEALANVNQQAYLASYQNQLSGLQGFANLPSNANNIAAQQSSIGQTQAAGIIGGANSAAAQQQTNMNNAGTAASIGLQAWDTFSDIRLKSDIQYVGDVNGHRTYSWVWNKNAAAIGLHGMSSGVIAQEVEQINPGAVGECNGYKTVNYEAIGVPRHGLHV
jgi:hypothetical protein